MKLLLRSKTTAIALSVVSGWALSGWQVTQLSAEDKFIKQPARAPLVAPAAPSLSETPEAGATPAALAPTGHSTGAWISNPKSTKASVDLHTATLTPSTPGPAPSLDSANSSGQTAPSASTHESNRTDASPVRQPVASATVEPSGPSQLRWLARSALPARAANNTSHAPGPLEFINPNFTTATTEPKHPSSSTPATLGVPTQQIPSQQTATMPKFSTAESTWVANTETQTALEEQVSSKKILASLVSSQIIADRPGNETSGRQIRPIDAPPGWQAVGEEMGQRIANCEALLNRKAYYSAREEAESAMLTLVRVLDLISNRYDSEPAWFAASKAMHEAEDFSSAQRLTSDSDILRRIILSHETPVLKDADVTTLAPLAAAQHYRQFAETKLLEAAQGHPWAAEVVYALGRTYQAQADVVDDGSDQPLRWKAVTLYRAARAIAPSNAVATNQLGYVLLQMDRAADAREALIASLNTNPSLQAFENLVEASRRLGDQATGNWAMQQALALKSTMVSETNVPAVIEVDPRTFAALSPYTIGPNPQHIETAQQPYRTAAYPMSPNSNH